MAEFLNIPPDMIEENLISMIGDRWMLVTAEKDGKANTMTASWGGAGVMWNKPSAFVFIRPQRYTFEFIEESDTLTLSFFHEKYRDALKLCGSVSGRDRDKIAEAGLTLTHRNGMPCFEEAEITLFCRKRYAQLLNEESVCDPSVKNNYAAGDYHKMYICEIVVAEVRE
ncbi:MAG: flavin reductase family protein [Clostridia bacterium]|nr:flavin reductase family protein [Clostridia bacterium]